MDALFLRVSSFLPRSRFSRGIVAATALHLLKRAELAEVLNKPDKHTLLLAQILWAEAARRGIPMREWRPLHSVRNTFSITIEGREIIFEGIPPLGSHPEWWVNHKAIMKKRFRRVGLPVPHGGSAITLARAQKIFKGLGGLAVVKPETGSASRHTTMHVESAAELERAFKLARKLSPFVSIEEELPGAVYRPTLVDGRLIATLRRDQPHVMGDGRSTIEELVASANVHPARQGPYFSPLTLGPAAHAELNFQNLTTQSIPAKGQRVRLHQKINWSLGGTTADVTDEAHPVNRALFERAAALLKAPLVGLDFIAEDIGKPWHEQQCGFIEANDMPYFDNHHLPFEGRPRDIAGPVWNLALSMNAGA